MPAAAKEALIEIGSRPRRPAANGKASPAKPGAAPAADAKTGGSEQKGAPAPADAAWSEAQELALVQASSGCFLAIDAADEGYVCAVVVCREVDVRACRHMTG
jgi:hypothetical protein